MNELEVRPALVVANAGQKAYRGTVIIAPSKQRVKRGQLCPSR